ncbi:MAG TPA: peptide MFS transporter [Polyangia bacterium]|nr:peptide MFS transporter [Polyangia bacterium]
MSTPGAGGVSAPVARVRQPRGLYLLFTVEMWERFSFYGMRAIFVLFVADSARGGLGWSKAAASQLFGLYGFVAYSLPILGGYLADRFIGTHRSMVIGAVILALGHFCMALPSTPTFFLGASLVVIGTGFFKVNASTMVGQLYGPNDARRDGGFTIFYMGVNVGATLGQVVCGYFGESARWGWHYGFGAAGVGMLLGLGVYLRLRPKYLRGIGEPPRRAPKGVTASTAKAAPPAEPLTRDERDRVVALLIVIACTIPFWMAFEQAGSSMNFFADECTNRMVLGFRIPASWFQSINSTVLIVSAPLFAALWTALGRRDREPSTPIKMAIALVLVGIGFIFMVVGARRSDGGALVSPFWLVAAYSFHTFGELCLSPIGLSFVTKLAPLKYASLLMGVWFGGTAISELLAGQAAALTDRVAKGELFHLLGGQADFFLIFVISSFATAVVLAALAPWLRRRVHGLDA